MLEDRVSLKATKWALLQRPKTNAEKILLVGLAHHANSSHDCWIGKPTMAKYLGVSDLSYVRRLLRSLEAQNLVHTEARFTGKKRRSSKYTLPVVDKDEVPPEETPESPLGGTPGLHHYIELKGELKIGTNQNLKAADYMNINETLEEIQFMSELSLDQLLDHHEKTKSKAGINPSSIMRLWKSLHAKYVQKYYKPPKASVLDKVKAKIGLLGAETVEQAVIAMFSDWAGVCTHLTDMGAYKLPVYPGWDEFLKHIDEVVVYVKSKELGDLASDSGQFVIDKPLTLGAETPQTTVKSQPKPLTLEDLLDSEDD